jgi:hypothetical protein
MSFNFKKIVVGTVMTLATVALGLFFVKRYAPESVKEAFRV